MTLIQPNLTPVNLTGYTATAQIKGNFSDKTVYNFTTSIPDPPTGKVNLVLPSSVSAGIQPGSYIWDFQVKEPNGNVRTYIAGDVIVYDEVTNL